MILVRPILPEEASEAKLLILAGLEERWGELNEELNQDLDHLVSARFEGAFLVAVEDGSILGTGALSVSGRDAEIARMSVSAGSRRRGIGSAILDALVGEARARGCKRCTLETTASWSDARAFYVANGFRLVAEDGNEATFALDVQHP